MKYVSTRLIITMSICLFMSVALLAPFLMDDAVNAQSPTLVVDTTEDELNADGD